MTIRVGDQEAKMNKVEALMLVGWLVRMALYVQPDGHGYVLELGKDTGEHLVESGGLCPTTTNCSPSGHRYDHARLAVNTAHLTNPVVEG